jgi:uncharacterized membrane protein
MFGTLDALFAATVVFVGGHFLLSSQPVRDPAVKFLGAQGFTTVYSLAMTGALLWLVVAYGAAPPIPVWYPPIELYWIPTVLNALAAVLVVCGVTTRSPTMVGGDRRAAELGPEDPAPGILRITRHPFLWGAALWAFSHLCVNGDAASIVVFAGMLILALGGMVHIDMKRQRQMGAGWGPIQLTTSLVPFAALIAGRTKMDWKGLGLWRPVAGLAVYAAVMHLHPWLVGVSALPPH